LKVQLTVGKITIQGPDTMTADDFGKFIDAILLRMDRLTSYDMQLEGIASTASTTATAAAVSAATSAASGGTAAPV
jgi:hypothetical protein